MLVQLTSANESLTDSVVDAESEIGMLKEGLGAAAEAIDFAKEELAQTLELVEQKDELLSDNQTELLVLRNKVLCFEAEDVIKSKAAEEKTAEAHKRQTAMQEQLSVVREQLSVLRDVEKAKVVAEKQAEELREALEQERREKAELSEVVAGLECKLKELEARERSEIKKESGKQKNIQEGEAGVESTKGLDDEEAVDDLDMMQIEEEDLNSSCVDVLVHSPAVKAPPDGKTHRSNETKQSPDLTEKTTTASSNSNSDSSGSSSKAASRVAGGGSNNFAHKEWILAVKTLKKKNATLMDDFLAKCAQNVEMGAKLEEQRLASQEKLRELELTQSTAVVEVQAEKATSSSLRELLERRDKLVQFLEDALRESNAMHRVKSIEHRNEIKKLTVQNATIQMMLDSMLKNNRRYGGGAASTLSAASAGLVSSSSVVKNKPLLSVAKKVIKSGEGGGGLSKYIPSPSSFPSASPSSSLSQISINDADPPSSPVPAPAAVSSSASIASSLASVVASPAVSLVDTSQSSSSTLQTTSTSSSTAAPAKVRSALRTRQEEKKKAQLQLALNGGGS